MERRQALMWTGLVALGAACGLGGAWALADEASDSSGASPLGRAIAEARRRGKPVLVLVGPEPPEGLTRIGESFGALLDLGGDDLLHDLLLCELACATPTQLFDAAGVKSVPNQLVLLELTASGFAGKPIDFIADVFALAPEQFDAAIEANKQALRTALARDDALLNERAEAARAALGAQAVAEFTARMDRGEPVTAVELPSSPALLRVRADWPTRVNALNDLAFRHFFKLPPRGSRWAAHGCGSTEAFALATDDAGVRYDLQRRVNGESPALRLFIGRPLPNPFALAPAGVLCGMAFGGPHGGRFLLFYIDEP